MKLAFFPAIAVVLASATQALAQEAEVKVSTTPPATAVVVAPATESAPKKEEKKDEEDKDTAHFRFGMGLDADYIFTPKTSSLSGLQGFGAGLVLRLGAQINQWFAIYYQPHAIVGGTISETKTPIPGAPSLPNATLIGAVFNSALIEATLPILQIGAGPSVDVLGIKDYSLTANDPGSTKPYFGADGRVALVLGGHGPGSHGGFAINGNVHPTFWNGTVLMTLSLGIGGEFY
jgi:hypothetical protein